MSRVVEEFVAFLGWEVDDDELKEFDKTIGQVGDKIKKVAAVIAGATAAFGAFLVVTNKETAEMSNLAASVGISAENLEALTNVVKGLGFQADNVVDLIEELNNKFGEMKGLGEMTAVKESLHILNLEFKELQKLSPEKQFQEIIDAALQLEDAQKAVAAVDMLMGGEANKILGFLRARGTTLDEILEKYKKLNLLTQEGREGAKQFAMVWGEFTTVLGSALKLFAGLAGEIIAPMISDFTDFVLANKELIQTEVRKWVLSVISVFKFLWSVISTLATPIITVIDKLGGLKNAAKLLGIAFGAIKLTQFLIAIQKILKITKALSLVRFREGLTSLFEPGKLLTTLLFILALAIEDLIVYFKGGNSQLGIWGESIGKFIHGSLKPLLELIPFVGSAIADMSQEEFDMAVVKTVDDLIELFSVTLPNALGKALEAVNAFFLILNDENISFKDKALAVWKVILQIVPFVFETIGEAAALLFLQLDKLFPNLSVSILEFAATVENTVKGVFNSILGFYSDIVNQAELLIAEIFSSLASLPDRVVALFEKAKNKITGILSEIPLVKAAFRAVSAPASEEGEDSSGGLFQNLQQGLSGLIPGESNPLRASPGGSGSPTVNDYSDKSIRNAFNIVQSPGESGEGFSRRVVQEMNKEIATAVRNNESGVVY